MKVDNTVCLDMIAVDACSLPTHASITKMDSIIDDQTKVDTDRLDLQQLNSNSYDSVNTTHQTNADLKNVPFKDNDYIFHSSYGQARQFHKMLQFGRALEKYRIVLQCKHRTIKSEPEDIQEKFCSALFYIGKLHAESGMDDTMRGLEAMYFCLNVRRSCFGSTHPSIANVLVELASLHTEYAEHENSLNLLLEALSILLPDISPEREANNALLVQVWNDIGRAQRALGQDDEAQSSFEEATNIKI